MTYSIELPPDRGEGFDVERFTIDYSVYYALHEPEELLSDPPPLLIATHGYGQSCRNFMRMIRPLHHRGFLIVAPQAPNHFNWQREPRSVGFAWVTEFEPENTLKEILAYLERLVEEVAKKRTFDPNKVFLMGFSQGVGMAYQIAAHGIVKPAGLIACAGALPPDIVDRLPEMTKFPTLLIHGDQDQSVPIEKAEEAEFRLTDNGFEVDRQFFQGEHNMPADKLDYIADWIRKLAQT